MDENILSKASPSYHEQPYMLKKAAYMPWKICNSSLHIEQTRMLKMLAPIYNWVSIFINAKFIQQAKNSLQHNTDAKIPTLTVWHVDMDGVRP